MQRDDSRVNVLALLVASIFFLPLSVACNPGGEEPEKPSGSSDGIAAVEPMAGSEDAGGTADKPKREIDPSRRPESLPEGVEAAIPENFPSDVAIYPGAEPAQGRGARKDDLDLSAVQLLTADSADKAFQFYSNKLESDGWSVDDVKQNETGGTFTASKGNRKLLVVIAPASDGGADIYIVTEG